VIGRKDQRTLFNDPFRINHPEIEEKTGGDLGDRVPEVIGEVHHALLVSVPNWESTAAITCWRSRWVVSITVAP
jgi:hypothetical protein